MNFTKPVLKTKIKATAVHLSMSIVVFAYLAYQIYFVWYPQPYFEIDGGWQGIRLIGAVDLVLGPLITFLIFDLTKSRKAILFDLIVILVIQFGALAYGIYTTYAQRPVAIVMIDDFVVPATMEHYGGKLESADELLKYSDERPPIIYSKLPLNKEALAEINRKKLDEKVLEHAQTEYYQSPEGMVTFLEEHQPRMQEALEHYKAGPAYETWLKANGKTADDVYIVRFSGRYGSAWLVFDRDGKYLSYFEV